MGSGQDREDIRSDLKGPRFHCLLQPVVDRPEGLSDVERPSRPDDEGNGACIESGRVRPQVGAGFLTGVGSDYDGGVAEMCTGDELVTIPCREGILNLRL